MRCHSLLLLLPILACLSAHAADEAATKAASAPATTLTVALISNKDSYPLNPEQSGEAFRKILAGNGRKPQASKVDLTLRVTNPTDQDITFNFGGDDSNITFALTGEGAKTVENLVMMTREFRVGRPITLAPGKSHDIPLTSLSGGLRGVTQLSYFTEAGDYRLSATLTYTAGEKQYKLGSDPIAIKVAKPDAAK